MGAYAVSRILPLLLNHDSDVETRHAASFSFGKEFSPFMSLKAVLLPAAAR
jgi:hypothetical protein